MIHLTKQKLKSTILTFIFGVFVLLGSMFIFSNLGCKPAQKAKTAAILINIKEVTCKTLDYICKYKDFVCKGSLLKVKK